MGNQAKHRRYHEMMLQYKEVSERMEENLPIKKELNDTCKKLKEIQQQSMFYSPIVLSVFLLKGHYILMKMDYTCLVVRKK